MNNKPSPPLWYTQAVRWFALMAVLLSCTGCSFLFEESSTEEQPGFTDATPQVDARRVDAPIADAGSTADAIPLPDPIDAGLINFSFVVNCESDCSCAIDGGAMAINTGNPSAECSVLVPLNTDLLLQAGTACSIGYSWNSGDCPDNTQTCTYTVVAGVVGVAATCNSGP